jgi:hypothetical protein
MTSGDVECALGVEARAASYSFGGEQFAELTRDRAPTRPLLAAIKQ